MGAFDSFTGKIGRMFVFLHSRGEVYPTRRGDGIRWIILRETHVLQNVLEIGIVLGISGALPATYFDSCCF